jgi:hypothetical protein
MHNTLLECRGTLMGKYAYTCLFHALDLYANGVWSGAQPVFSEIATGGRGLRSISVSHTLLFEGTGVHDEQDTSCFQLYDTTSH